MENARELPLPKVETYCREELEFPVVFTEPVSGQVF